MSILLKDGILVVDDIERKNKDLSLEKVFGSINYLAEKKLRKAIIIFSESNLSIDDKQSLENLREKIVDIEFKFSPDAEENAKLITNLKDEIDLITKLDVRNIRIIKKIHKANIDLVESFKFESASVKGMIREAVGILTYIHYSNQVPFSLDDVPNQISWLTSDDDIEKSNAKTLEEYGYSFDEREYPIFDYLKNGIIDSIKWQINIKSFEMDYQSEELKKSLSKLWRSYNGNFQNNYAEIITQFENFLNSFSDKLYPSQILEILNLFDNIEHDYSGSNWLTKSTLANVGKLGRRDLDILKSRITEPEIIREIEKKELEIQVKHTLESAFKNIVYKGSWSQEETSLVQNASVDEYMDWLKNSTNTDLLSLIRSAFNMFTQFGGDYQKAADNLYKGAIRLAEETENSKDKKLNIDRVKTFLKKGT